MKNLPLCIHYMLPIFHFLPPPHPRKKITETFSLYKLQIIHFLFYTPSSLPPQRAFVATMP